MKNYEVTFTEKVSKKVFSVIVSAKNDIGICLKGRIKFLENGFRFDWEKHSISFKELVKR